MKSTYQINLKLLFFTLLFSTLLTFLSACSGSCGSNQSSVPPQPSPPQMYAVTINSTGTIPILGNMATRTAIHIHNNSGGTISNISYEVEDSGAKSTSFVDRIRLKFMQIAGIHSQPLGSIDSTSADMCSQILAGQSCALEYTTPMPDGVSFQGSVAIKLSYKMSGVSHSFSQLINYKQIDSTLGGGVDLASSVNMTAYPNIPSYATLYLYGRGDFRTYKVKDLVLDKPNLIITQGNIIGQNIQSNFIQAVEISAPALPAGTTLSASLNVISEDVDSSSKYQHQGSIGLAVTPSTNGAILITGIAPVVNTTTSADVIMPIINSGNTPATSISITYPSGIIAGPSVPNQCGSTLAPNTVCNISLSIGSQSTFGSGAIILTYSGGINTSVSQDISWYNVGSPIVSMSASNNPLSFNATESVNTVITVTNIGDKELTNITLPAVVVQSGSAVGTIVNDNCTGTALAKNVSCTYTLNVTAATATFGQLLIGMNANYNDGASKTYSRVMVINYSASDFRPILVVTIPALSIVGNNVESQTVNVTVSNSGAAAATITNNGLTNAPAYVTTTGTCVGTLAAGSSCIIPTVKAGPTIASSTLTPSGISYDVTYYGGTISSGSPTTSNGAVGITVQPNNQNISILSAPVVTQYSSGDGSNVTPYIFLGSNTQSKTVTVTYTNSGVNPIQITGVSNTNSGYNWAINTSSSTCYNGSTLPSLAIAPNSTCTIVFRNALLDNYLGLVAVLGASYAMNLTLPTIIFKDTVATTTQFSQQPSLPAPLSGTTLYVQSQQATLSSSLSQAVAVGGDVTITNTLANATGYSNILVTSLTEDYFTGAPTLSNCTQSAANGVNTQICTLNAATLNGSGIYTLQSSLGAQTLHGIYSFDTSNQLVSVSQTNGSLVLH
jgi:hypothetical protein